MIKPDLYSIGLSPEQISVFEYMLDRIEALEKTQPKHFQKPTQQDIAIYMSEKGCQGYIEEADRFFNYYESNGWCVGKKPMKDWKAAVRNWLKNNYSQPNKSERNAVSASLRNIQNTDW